MKRTAALVALLSFFSVLAPAQDHPEWTTGNLFNGRYWVSLNLTGEAFYMNGYRDGFIAGAFKSPDKAEDLQREWFPFNLPEGDVIKGVDKFYSEPENLRFPIPFAIQIFAMKVAGASQKEIDLRMEWLRKQFP